MTHTPGPWSLHNSGGECNVGHFDGYLKSEIKAGSDIIYIRQSVAGRSFPQLVANLGLMIAAPDMLAALLAHEREIQLNDICSNRDPSASFEWMAARDEAVAKCAAVLKRLRDNGAIAKAEGSA